MRRFGDAGRMENFYKLFIECILKKSSFFLLWA